MLELGQRMRDRVTGFEGIAIARVEYLNGCIQYCLKPEMGENGKMPEGEYIDDQQLEVIGVGLSLEKEPDGGPMPDTPPTRYGSRL